MKMERINCAIDYAGAPHRMLLELVELAGDNDRLRRMWQRNYLRITNLREVRV